MLAAKFGHAKCLRMLLEKGADKDAKGRVRFCMKISVLAFVLFSLCFVYVLVTLSAFFFGVRNL